MEFYAAVKGFDMDRKGLTHSLSIKNLPKYCASIDNVITDNVDDGVIYCLWGEFKVNREVLKHGVRFSLPNCPNALAWTITREENEGCAMIHCTINKQQHDEDFIESIEQFVSDWKDGITNIRI